MNLKIQTKIPSFQKAFDKTYTVLKAQQFWDAIASHPAFDIQENSSPAEIARLLHDTNHPIIFLDWKPTWWESKTRYKKTTAITKDMNISRLNVRKSDRPINNIAGTIIHEAVHAIDNAYPDKKFGHGGNSSKGKENMAPYWIGNLAIAILDGKYHKNRGFEDVLNNE